MKLSVVVPAYRQEATIYGDVRAIQQALAELDLEHEIIVVVDGDVDGTFRVASSLGGDGVTVLSYPQNQGKGYAVRHGMRGASGDVIAFIDAGGDLHAGDLCRAVQQLVEHDADIVVGSKRHSESVVHYPLLRRAYSAAYQALTWVLFGLNVRDTQAGLKAFRRPVVAAALPLLSVKRFAFDVEFLAVARLLGYRKIEESPIHVRLVFGSTIGGRAVLGMVWDTLGVFLRLRLLGHYRIRPATDASAPVSSATGNG